MFGLRLDIQSDLVDQTEFWTDLEYKTKRLSSLEKFMQIRTQTEVWSKDKVWSILSSHPLFSVTVVVWCRLKCIASSSWRCQPGVLLVACLLSGNGYGFVTKLTERFRDHALNFWPNSQTSILNRWLQQWRHLVNVNKLYRARLVASGTICLLFLHLVVWILILNVISISVVEYIHCWRLPTLCCIDQLCLAVKSSTRPVGGGGQSRLMPLPGFILVWPLTFSILIVLTQRAFTVVRTCNVWLKFFR